MENTDIEQLLEQVERINAYREEHGFKGVPEELKAALFTLCKIYEQAKDKAT